MRPLRIVEITWVWLLVGMAGVLLIGISAPPLLVRTSLDCVAGTCTLERSALGLELERRALPLAEIVSVDRGPQDFLRTLQWVLRVDTVDGQPVKLVFSSYDGADAAAEELQALIAGDAFASLQVRGDIDRFGGATSVWGLILLGFAGFRFRHRRVEWLPDSGELEVRCSSPALAFRRRLRPADVVSVDASLYSDALPIADMPARTARAYEGLDVKTVPSWRGFPVRISLRGGEVLDALVCSTSTEAVGHAVRLRELLGVGRRGATGSASEGAGRGGS